MQAKQKATLKILFFCAGFINMQVDAADQHAGNWLIKQVDHTTCVAQSSLQQGVILETKKLTLPVKEMNEIQFYQVTLNGKVALTANKPNLVDTSCKCIRLRNMDSLNADEINIRIDARTTNNTDMTIKWLLKDIPQAMTTLQADNCHKSQKNLASLSVRQ
jgi:hypothetical protein